MDLLLVGAIGLGGIALASRLIGGPRRKLSFDAAILAAKSAPFQRFDDQGDKIHLDNGQVSVFYSIDPEHHERETVDMLTRKTFGSGGLIITYIRGEPYIWGRYGDRLGLPGMDPEQAQKARDLYKEVKKALEQTPI